MTLVVDASVVVAALVDRGPTGRWAESILGVDQLVAPALLHVEVSNILRRLEASGKLAEPVASLAFRDLLALPVEAVAFEPFAARIWELRPNVTGYDAWYVAVAEALGVPLATLDTRLSRAEGPRCAFRTP